MVKYLLGQNKNISSIFFRDELDQKAFQEAGLARAVKTYKYDPTKPVTIKPKLK